MYTEKISFTNYDFEYHDGVSRTVVEFLFNPWLSVFLKEVVQGEFNIYRSQNS